MSRRPLIRCHWATNGLSIAYHDLEWGVPLHEDRKLFEEFGDFDSCIWSFVGGKPRMNDWRKRGHAPARAEESDAMSKDMLRRGLKFVGSTICYAYMQAVGMVNDHEHGCFRRDQIG